LKVESKITVNGKEYSISENSTLAAFMREHDIAVEKTVVAVNGDVIKREDMESCRLKNGDTIDLMTFVGGG
jgi:sulfur carrier protein